MFRSVKPFFVLLVAAMAAQLCPNSAQATTVSELLNTLQQRQLSIQDYNFVVNRSFFFEALEEEDIEAIIQQRREVFGIVEPTLENVERRLLSEEYSRIKLAKGSFTGALFQIKGIGLATMSYAIYGIPDPQTHRMVDFLNASPEERENNPDFFTVPKPTMLFRQQQISLPDLFMESMPPSSQAKNEAELFQLPPGSIVTIQDSRTDSYRYSCFPFWHEEALLYATLDNTTIVSESDDEIELLITPVDAPFNFSFILSCNRKGRVNRYVKKIDEQTLLKADYLHFVEIAPGGVEIPQVGRMWMPARDPEGGAWPNRNTTRIATILLGEINSGLTLGDLVIDTPEGTTIVDQRTGSVGPRRITTTRPVRLGADLPDDINDLNLED